jgi:lysophospholipase L1-like esterase
MTNSHSSARASRHSHHPSLNHEFDGPRTPFLDVARYNRLDNVPAIVAFPNRQAIDTAMTAQLLGCNIADLRRIREGLRAAIDEASEDLLSDRDFGDAVSALPFASGDTVVAVGDSVTADALSWAEILATVLTRVRPGEVKVINASVSGDTSADLIARSSLIAAQRPQWVIAMIGVNDARRHGPGGAARMASLGETERNLRTLAELVHRQMQAHLVLVTPAPVHDPAVLRYETFRELSVTWRSEEIAQIAEVIRQQNALVVDVHRALSTENLADYLTADGIHPSLAGQQQIVRALVTALGARARKADRTDRGNIGVN